METCHGGGRNEARAKDFHAAVEAVVDYEVMRHTDAVWFHGVALSVVVVPYFCVVEVGYTSFASV
eukprot:7987982-Ditylum_brightwellii.AAC.1